MQCIEDVIKFEKKNQKNFVFMKLLIRSGFNSLATDSKCPKMTRNTLKYCSRCQSRYLKDRVGLSISHTILNVNTKQGLYIFCSNVIK